MTFTCALHTCLGLLLLLFPLLFHKLIQKSKMKCLPFSSRVLQEHCGHWGPVSGLKGPGPRFECPSLVQICMCSPTRGSSHTVDSDTLGFPCRCGNSCPPTLSSSSFTRVLGFGCGWSLAVGFPHVFTLKAARIKGGGERGKLEVSPLGGRAVCVSS